MAAINKNIKTGNFIPGSETYTRPEEIAIMSKYLKAGIQGLKEKTFLGGRETVLTTPGQAEIKDIETLPGSETLSSLQDTAQELSLSRVSESIKVQKETKLIDKRETLEDDRDMNISSNILEISKKKVELYNQSPESIESNEEGSKINVTENVYDNIFWKNPKIDKRILPDSENEDSKFKKLDSLLGGIHYDKYSQEGLAQSVTPSLDAQKAYNEGTDVIFVHPEKLNKQNITDLRKNIDPLGINKKSENLENKSEILPLDNKVKQLSNETDQLRDKQEILSLDNKVKQLSNEIDQLKDEQEISSLSNFSETLDRSKESANLSSTLINIPKPNKLTNLEEESKSIQKTEEVELSDVRKSLDPKYKELVLSNFLDKILEGKINSLSNLKHSLPGELKVSILVDYLKDKIKDDNEIKLYESLIKLTDTEIDTILGIFVDKLTGDLKKVVKLNKDYITLGKEKGTENFLKDLYTNLSDLINSNFSPYIPGEIKDSLLKLNTEEFGTKIPESTNKNFIEFQKQLKNLYELSTVSSEELGKSLNELDNYSGNWGKKVSAYLTSILGKYKNFKEYLPKEDIINFKKVVSSTFNERDYEDFLKDPEAVTKETLIRQIFNFLKEMTIIRAKNIKSIITKRKLEKILSENNMYSLSTKEQIYGEPITFRKALSDTKTELIDETWNTIKSWLKSVLNESLFGTTASLMLDKAKLPGQDYGHDVTVRNVPEVIDFYNKKTKTTDFTGTAYSTALETKSTKSSGISNWLNRVAGRKNYNFKENYLMSKGVRQTLKDLCETDINKISSVEDLFDVLKNSETMTAHARTENGVMNGMTLSSNHVWEITIEPYLGDYNGNCTWLPFINEINRYNYETHGVRTIYDKWLPITSFELQDKRLVNKTLQLYSGEISYPVSIEYTNELRLTFADDSFKSFKTYFDKVAEVSAYESSINTKIDYSITKQDTIKIKQRTYSGSSKDYHTYTTINKKKFAVGMYKNLCFSINIYILTPQYSTIKKYSLLCVMKDYSIEYIGEIDSGPSDVTVTFSIVGDTSEIDKIIRYNSETSKLSEDIMNKIKTDVDMSANLAVPNERQVAPITVIDIEIEDNVEEIDNTYDFNEPVFDKHGEWKSEPLDNSEGFDRITYEEETNTEQYYTKNGIL